MAVCDRSRAPAPSSVTSHSAHVRPVLAAMAASLTGADAAGCVARFLVAIRHTPGAAERVISLLPAGPFFVAEAAFRYRCAPLQPPCADARIHRNAGLHARNAAAARVATGEPGNPERADDACRAPLPRRVPVRPAGGRSSARAVVARAARSGPAGPAAPQRGCIREDLDAAGLAAARAFRSSGAGTAAQARGPLRRPGPGDPCHELRPAVDRGGSRAPAASERTTSARPAALSPVLGHDHGFDLRTCDHRACALAMDSRAAIRQ